MGVLTGIDELVTLKGGTPVKVLSGGEPVNLTRRLAIIHALEDYSDTSKGNKFRAFDLGMRFELDDEEISIDSEESVMIQAALEKAWPQPGIYVPLCTWLEGKNQPAGGDQPA